LLESQQREATITGVPSGLITGVTTTNTSETSKEESIHKEKSGSAVGEEITVPQQLTENKTEKTDKPFYPIEKGERRTFPLSSLFNYLLFNFSHQVIGIIILWILFFVAICGFYLAYKRIKR